jgi:adenylylsulfate kinase-like enzyme
VKGLYRRARAGLLPQFTGIDSGYERPLSPEIHIETLRLSAQDAARQIARFVTQRPIDF